MTIEPKGSVTGSKFTKAQQERKRNSKLQAYRNSQGKRRTGKALKVLRGQQGL